MLGKLKICASSDLRENAAVKFSVPDPRGAREGFAIRHGGRVSAYFNECAHISLPLDWDDGDFFSADFSALVCKNHGAMYEPETGHCTAGPCAGVSLKKIQTTEENGVLYAVFENT
jgi:nitrite reductase/ring-hydroxylating ferredoxin subunit